MERQVHPRAGTPHPHAHLRQDPPPSHPLRPKSKALSHITGGGFTENIPRVLPHGTGCVVDVSQWVLPPVFRFVMQRGNVAPQEMCRTFNCGIGMVLVVARADVDEVKKLLHGHGEPPVSEIGEIISGKGVELRGLKTWTTMARDAQ